MKIKTEDLVNQPTHYALDNIECIDAMVEVFGEQAVKKYAEIAAFKYVWRMNRKNKLSSQDKKKLSGTYATRWGMILEMKQNNFFGEEPKAWEDHWQDMPEFVQEKKNPLPASMSA